MKKFIADNKVFILLYLLFLITGAGIIFHYEHGSEILYFNNLHTPVCDQIFKYVTQMAEWPLLLFIVVIAVRFSLGNGLLLGLNAILVFAITSILKAGVFPNQVRPSVYFEGRAQLNFVQGVTVYHHYSFPSGHTASAFALFFMMSIMVRDKRWAPLFFMLALLVGISRMYLLEHFFRDVYLGSIVGIATTAIFYVTFAQSRFYQSLNWKDKVLWR